MLELRQEELKHLIHYLEVAADLPFAQAICA
jgi:hypothetical protein